MDDEKQSEVIDWQLFQEFVNEFKGETDRAAVILGVAKLDSLLYQILKYYFVVTPSSSDELLDGDSPLGTFSAKIYMMYRLGLIDASFARSLHIIRRIRNDFAHEVSGSTINSGSHKDRVKELSIPFQSLTFFEYFKETFFKNDKSASTNFRVVLSILVARLEAMLNKTNPLESKAWVLVTNSMKNYERPVKEVKQLEQ
ncbi:MAG: hypothetical protein WCS69_00415 [Ignavibacteriaceae bacterium]|jgi:DNA-binding MltR family transcriptional regulator